MNQGTNLQIEGIEFCSQKDSKKQNDSQVVAEGCRALPLERRPIVGGELADDALRLRAYASRLAEAAPSVTL